MTKIKTILFQEGEPGNLWHRKSAAGFERTEVFGPDTTRFRAPLCSAKIKRRWRYIAPRRDADRLAALSLLKEGMAPNGHDE